MATLTFEQLPQAVSDIAEKLDRIERLLLAKNEGKAELEGDRFLNIKELSEMIKLAKATIYGLVCRAEIPVYKRGHRLYFSKQEIIEWIKAGKRKTRYEIEQAADDYLAKNRRKYN